MRDDVGRPERFLHERLHVQLLQVFRDLFGDKSRNDDDGNIDALLAKELEKGRAIDGRHFEIKQDERGILVSDGVDRVSPFDDADRPEVRGPENVLEEVDDTGLIVDDEHRFGDSGNGHRAYRAWSENREPLKLMQSYGPDNLKGGRKPAMWVDSFRNLSGARMDSILRRFLVAETLVSREFFRDVFFVSNWTVVGYGN